MLSVLKVSLSDVLRVFRSLQGLSLGRLSKELLEEPKVWTTALSSVRHFEFLINSCTLQRSLSLVGGIWLSSFTHDCIREFF